MKKRKPWLTELAVRLREFLSPAREVAMKPLRCVAILAGAGLLLGTLTLVWHSPARAEPEEEDQGEVTDDPNPKMDCIQDGARGNNNAEWNNVKRSWGHQGCIDCHKNPHPVAGRGDRPKTKYGTVLLYNKSNKRMKYEIKRGRNGQWVSRELAPRQVRRYTEIYKRKGQNKSPKYFIRYERDGEDKVKHLVLAATPNKKIGNLYYFDKDRKDGEVSLFTPSKPVYRGKKHK
jgi:hypothetical protein